MNAQIEELQRIASQLTPEQARYQLAEIEAQEQVQIEQVYANVEELGQIANQSLSDFMAAKQANDEALSTWLSQGQRIIEARQRLEKESQTVFSHFMQWSSAGFDSGILKDPSGFRDNGAKTGRVQVELKRLTGDANLMTWPKVVPNSIASYLLNVVGEFMRHNQLR